MRYYVTIGERTFVVDLGSGRPVVGGVEVDATLAAVPGTQLRHLLAEGVSTLFVARPGDRVGRWELASGATRLLVDVTDERTRAIREMVGEVADEIDHTVAAPMPGLVLRVDVVPGDRVVAGQGLLIVEAMKMENELKAPVAGLVARVSVEVGQIVEKGAVLIVLE